MENLNQNQNYRWIIGIDVSKESLDVCLINNSDGQLFNGKFNNNFSGFRNFKAWCKTHACECDHQSLCCMEHTGLYTRQLVHYLLSRQVNVWLESSLHIKRSMGLVRGKSDAIDAQRIARFVHAHQSDAKPLNLSALTLDKLKDLNANRNRLMKAIQSLQVSTNELKQVDSESGKTVERVNREAIRGLEKSLQAVEEKITEFIKADEDLNKQFDLITTVKGVGKVLALLVIIYTQGCTKIVDGRKLACYSGVAPFEYRSGTSILGRTGVSKFANSELKRVLHMAAISSVQHNLELKQYYNRKVAEGKSKMAVINAVRNKLIHRIVAVIKRGTPYQTTLKNNLQIS
ncbi:IS110 family transposase [Chryseolinea sp. H1M3-3]|uniref:IS110 family transposase n=1 Tax=Chryseolinea sp. H1M3-3 TaxID=3034144 RepID=UPI0023EACDBC|nr:IS110 family transposase [Chryseolinea sp. H1M3-3]